jgi:hypothetical protein
MHPPQSPLNRGEGIANVKSYFVIRKQSTGGSLHPCSPNALMNYATLLALLAALSFTLPLLVQLGETAGVSRPSGIAVTLLFVIFLVAWLLLRRPLKKQAENGESTSVSSAGVTESQIENRSAEK